MLFFYGFWGTISERNKCVIKSEVAVEVAHKLCQYSVGTSAAFAAVSKHAFGYKVVDVTQGCIG